MRILLVEDEAALSGTLVRGLQEEGHRVDLCESGRDAVEQGRQLNYDAIVLDWMLPGMDGLAVLRAWRKAGLSTPVIMLTARGGLSERVLGLRSGADDYLAKPFAFEELLARLEALHRRTLGATSTRSVGDLSLDTRRRALKFRDNEITLTAREFGVAAAFFEHVGDIVTRSEMLARVWGEAFDGEPNVVDVYVGYLRKKLGLVCGTHVELLTVRGLGWRLESSRPESTR